MRLLINLLTIVFVFYHLPQLYAQGTAMFSWRYYRTGNTGIQGDINGAVWIDADGNPWISGFVSFLKKAVL
ncbi:MAG: hypothetical protein Kow0042_23290 [Calditrichia bacterium]